MVISCFGHRNTPLEVRGKLKNTFIEFMEQNGDILVYVGNHGRFDFLVVSVVRELKELAYPIECCVVLAYVPEKSHDFSYFLKGDTLVPEGIELTHPKGAILFRNRWMVDHSQTVIAYVVKDCGGAAKAVKYAKKQRREIVYL